MEWQEPEESMKSTIRLSKSKTEENFSDAIYDALFTVF